MSYVEGIGDEVLLSVAIITVIMISLLLWSLTESSATSPPRSPAFRNSQSPPVEPRYSGERDVNDNSTAERQPDSTPQEAPTSDPEPAGEATGAESPIQHPANEDEDDNEPVDVRQRRLEFFDKTGVESPDDGIQNCASVIANGSASGTSGNVRTEEGEEASPTTNGLIQIRLKYLDDTERSVHTPPLQIIQDFKRAHFADVLASNKLVRLISNGYVLEDSRSLLSYGLVDGSVIHVQIRANQASPTRPSSEAESELDIGQFLSPILGIALLCVWIMHFQYKEYFTTTATVALLVLSGLFLTVVWGQHGPRTFNTTVQ